MIKINWTEQFIKQQTECLDMLTELIEYDKQHGNPPEKARVLEGFIDTQRRALDMAATLLQKHKPALEEAEKAEREKFLVSMGMDRKERKKMNKREWYIYWIVPTIILIISTILFMRDTMTARMYPDDIRKICELQEAVVIAVWIVINGIYFWIMNRKARRG